LTSDRSYKKALTHEEVFKVMEEEKSRFALCIWKVFSDNHVECKKMCEEID